MKNEIMLADLARGPQERDGRQEVLKTLGGWFMKKKEENKPYLTNYGFKKPQEVEKERVLKLSPGHARRKQHKNR